MGTRKRLFGVLHMGGTVQFVRYAPRSKVEVLSRMWTSDGMRKEKAPCVLRSIPDAEVQMMSEIKYPCTDCTRVKDRAGCENKQCKEWRDWFIQKWEELRHGKTKKTR